MAETVIPGLTLNSDGAYTVGAATIHEVVVTEVESEAGKGYLLSGQTVSVNGVVYTLVNYLGGGTYGKVWSATGPDGLKYSIKIINVQYDSPDDTKEATEDVINEARVTKKLYETTTPYPICSNIYGIGITIDNFVIIVMDIFEITLDWYLEHGGSAKADELVWKLHKMLERVNGGGMKTSHGDVKGDNFMINSDGTLRAVDFGFGHIQGGGVDIQCNTLNSNNIGMGRDIVQFVIYLTLFYRSLVSKRVANAVAPIIGKLVSMKGSKEFKEKSLWSIAYRYLNLETNARDINTIANIIIRLVTQPHSQAVPLTLPVEDEPVIEDPPEVIREPLPTPTTIAATIEDKMTIKSSRSPAELTGAEEKAQLEAKKQEELNMNMRNVVGGQNNKKTPEPRRGYGGARKTRKRKSKKGRKTRSK
jgi:serine/threonine protein kinase